MAKWTRFAVKNERSLQQVKVREVATVGGKLRLRVKQISVRPEYALQGW